MSGRIASWSWKSDAAYWKQQAEAAVKAKEVWQEYAGRLENRNDEMATAYLRLYVLCAVLLSLLFALVVVWSSWQLRKYWRRRAKASAGAGTAAAAAADDD